MNTLEVITTALAEGQGENTVVLSCARQSGGLFDRMVITTAGSGRHLAALSARVLQALKQAGLKNCSVETSEEQVWALIDCGEAVVHIMREETRARYQLESLWGFEGENARN